MFGSGIDFSNHSATFVEQFIQLYTLHLGEWSKPYIAFCAFSVMFSTLLVIVDGFPRLARGLLVIPFVPLSNDKLVKLSEQAPINRVPYFAIAIIIALLSLGFLAYFSQSLVVMVDFATTLSFITAPFLAWFNFKALQSPRIALGDRPSRSFMAYSAVCVVLLTFVAAYYVWIRFL